jgi:phage terminase small subunit
MSGTRKNLVTQLTPKQEQFAAGYVANGGNATDAYLAAYDSGNRERATHEGSRLKRNPHVAHRIAELQDRASRECDITRERITWELVGAMEMAKLQQRPEVWGRIAMDLAKLHHIGEESDADEKFAVIQMLTEVGRMVDAKKEAKVDLLIEGSATSGPSTAE